MNQHRRDLNTNELEKLAGKMAPFFERHGSQILYAAAAVILATGVILYFVISTRSADSAGWEAFNAAQSAQDFGKVADDYRDEPVADWARVNEAERYVNQGVQAMFKDREGAEQDLENAKDIFKSLLDKSNLPQIVEIRAQLGLARCLESLSGRDTSDAVEAYKRFQDKFPDSVYEDFVNERIKVLESDAGKNFYAWFHDQNPKPSDIRKPLDGSSGLPADHPPVNPEDFVSLPEIPEMLELPDDASGTAPSFPDDASGAAPSFPDEPGRPAPPPLPEDREEKGKAPAFPDGNN